MRRAVWFAAGAVFGSIGAALAVALVAYDKTLAELDHPHPPPPPSDRRYDIHLYNDADLTAAQLELERMRRIAGA